MLVTWSQFPFPRRAPPPPSELVRLRPSTVWYCLCAVASALLGILLGAVSMPTPMSIDECRFVDSSENRLW